MITPRPASAAIRPLPAVGIARRHARLVGAVFLPEAAQLVVESDLRKLVAQAQHLALEFVLFGGRDAL